MAIAPFSQIQAEALVAQYKNVNTDKDYIRSVTKATKGIPAAIEQAVMLFKDFNRNGLKHISAESIEKIINIRLEILKKEDSNSYNLLVAMSVLGPKFYPGMLENYSGIDEHEFERIIETLVQRGYINQINTLAFEFKSKSIWKIIVSIIKNEQNLKKY